MSQRSEASVRREVLIYKINEEIAALDERIISKATYVDRLETGTEMRWNHMAQLDFLKGEKAGLRAALRLVESWA